MFFFQEHVLHFAHHVTQLVLCNMAIIQTRLACGTSVSYVMYRSLKLSSLVRISNILLSENEARLWSRSQLLTGKYSIACYILLQSAWRASICTAQTAMHNQLPCLVSTILPVAESGLVNSL